MTKLQLEAKPHIANWLKEQEKIIIPPWIRSVRRAARSSQIRRGPRTKQMESAQLMTLFDAIVFAVEEGTLQQLDAAIQELVTNRLGKGYKQVDFIQIAEELKSAIWQAAQQLAPEQTVQVLLCLEPIFSHSVVRLAWLASRAAEAQLEEELERARVTLEKLDRTKSDFISIAAHELKTPLTLIQGYTAILANDLGEQPQSRNLLDGLFGGIQRLRALIQDMIDVSMIDSEVLTLSWQPVALQELVRLAVNDLKEEAINRQVVIRLSRFPPEVANIFMDSQRMYQVFANLIGNAIKYTPDGGSVSITARVLHDPQQELDFVEITVTDTGIGIAADDLPHVFDKFYRVGDADLHSTSKTEFKGGGPGLGLAIARGIVSAHGGRIWAESPGYDEERCPGSTFHIVLPLYTEMPKSASERLLGLE